MKLHTKSIILLLSLTLLSISATKLTYALTFSQDVGVSFTFNPSIQVTLSSSDLIISNLAPGTANDSNIITVNVLTNNATGYTLNATVGNGTTFTSRDLKHNNSNITSKFTSVAFGSSIASNTSLEPSTWAYSYLDESLNNGTNTTWTNYNGLPYYNDETNIATLKASNDPVSSATGDEIQFKIAAKAASDQATGTYNNVINFTAVANPVPTPAPLSCPSGYICYSDSGVNSPTTMGNQSITSSDTTASLWASNFQNPGYGFAGWSDKYDWVLNQNDAYGNGIGVNTGYHIYGPNATISFTAGQYSGSNPGLALYAVWIPSAGNLQSFTCPNNSTMPIGTVTALADQRDNNVYAVAKLKDGKCWMVENLRLNNTASHNSDGTLAQGYNSSFIGLANPETSPFGSNSANSLYSTNGSTAAPAITGNYTLARFPRYNDKNTIYPDTSMTRTSGNIYSYGNWYTWPAAIADTSYYNTNNQSITTTSICPTGWSLPRGGDKSNEANNDFWSLIVDGINGGIKPANYDSDTRPYYTGAIEGVEASNSLRGYPNNFIYSGYFIDNSTNERGIGGYYWSSTVYDSTIAYYLFLGDERVRPGTIYFNKYRAPSIRCVR